MSDSGDAYDEKPPATTDPYSGLARGGLGRGWIGPVYDSLGRTVQGAGAYVAVTGIQRLASFVVIPLFAIVLTPGELGQLVLLVAATGFAGTLVGFGLENPLLRAAVRDPLGSEVSSIGRFLWVAPTAVGALLAVASIPLSPALELDLPWLPLSILAAAVLASASLLPLTTMRAAEEFGSFAAYALTLTAVSLSVRTWLILGLDMGISGWVTADLITAAVALLLGGRRQYLWTRATATVDNLMVALRIGLPLVPHLLSHWALSLSDRVILALFLLPAAIGVYGVAYQIGAGSLLLLTEIYRAIQPRFAEASNSAEALGRLPGFARALFVTSLAVAASVATAGVQLLYVAFSSDYSAGARYIPWVALAAVFLAMYFIPMSMMSLVVGDTRRVWVFTALAAAVNITLNLVLVPHFGAVAAAINTTIGYALLWLLMHWVAERKSAGLVWDVQLCWRPGAAILGITLITLPFVFQESWVGLLAAGICVLASWLVAVRWLLNQRRGPVSVGSL